MKIFYITFCFLIFSLLSAQKKYHFDYAFSVKESYKLNTIKFNSVFLVNSKNNTYHLYAHENKDSLKLVMHFIDYNGVSFNSQLSKTDFYKAETISKSCNEVVKFYNPYKGKSKKYDFINYSDTIINDTSYYHYAIKSNKKLKYQTRKKMVSTHFIVDKSDSKFLPFTYISSFYETWKFSKTVPNGIPKIIYFVNTKGEQTGKMEITKIKVDKYATIPEECDYSNPAIWDGRLSSQK